MRNGFKANPVLSPGHPPGFTTGGKAPAHPMQTKTNPTFARFLASIPNTSTQRSVDRRRRLEGRTQRHAAIRAAITEAKDTGFSVQDYLLSQGHFFGVRVAARIGLY